MNINEFPNFSPQVLEIMQYAKEEMERLQNDKLTPIHLMLGILRGETDKIKDLLSIKENMREELCQSLIKDAKELKKRTQTENEEEDESVEVDETTQRILRLSVLESKMMKEDPINELHLLLAIIHEPTNSVSRLLASMDITYSKVVNRIKSANTPNDSSDTDVLDSKNDEPTDDNEFSETNDMDADFSNHEEDEFDEIFRSTSTPSSSQPEDDSQDSKEMKVLKSFSMDLTQAAREGLLDPVHGREKEIERLVQIMCRRRKNNAVLLGEAGVGKTAIVEGLAHYIVSHKSPLNLWNKRVFMLDVNAIVAGTKYRGEFEERMQAVLKALRKHKEIIIFIDEFHTIVGAGNAQNSADAANLLKPALARGEIQCIGATTTQEYFKVIEKDPALERRLQHITVMPPSIEDSIAILNQLKQRYEDHHTVRYTPEAIEACVKMTERYITNRNLPDKAIDAMDETGSRVQLLHAPVCEEAIELQKSLSDLDEKLQNALQQADFELASEIKSQQKQKKQELTELIHDFNRNQVVERQTITEEDVRHTISVMTNIPLDNLKLDELERLRKLRETLSQKVIGQEEAVKTVVGAIQRNKLGLKDPKKPIASFLFVGPTGVGKTYLTKILSREMFQGDDKIIRIDMSEFSESHSASRLIGSPPGYVGYNEPPQLTDRVQRNPYSIVLFDEVEKAHNQVINYLLQILDEGHITDTRGTKVDFKNTIVIMTSNCGIKELKHGSIGFQSTAENGNSQKAINREILNKELKKHFPLEFINRLDKVVYFDSLDKDAFRKIVELELEPTIARVSEMGYTLELHENVKELLEEKGYDIEFGARPVKRVIQNLIEEKLCDYLLSETVEKGATLYMERKGDDVEISVKTHCEA